MGIPSENFGDAVTIVEFLNSFSFLFDVEEELGGAISLGINTNLRYIFRAASFWVAAEQKLYEISIL